MNRTGKDLLEIEKSLWTGAPTSIASTSTRPA